MKKKLYVLIRNDLKSMAYKAVQAGHGVAQFKEDYPNSRWRNEDLIYLVVKSEVHLKSWLRRVSMTESEVSSFAEPAMDNQVTVGSCSTANHRIFRNLQVLE